MQRLLWFSLLVLAASAAPLAPCNQNITITTPQWLMPSTLVAFNSTCTYLFTFPSDSYAVFNVAISSASTTDQVVVYDEFSDSFNMDTRNCANGCETINFVSNWPGAFSLTYLTGSTTTLKIQMSVTIKKMPNINVVGNITTSTNSDSSLIYLSDFKPGTSYVITSKGSKVSIKLPVAWNSFDLAEFAQLNNVFVYDGGKNVGTLNSRTGFGYVSQSNSITLVAVSTVDVRGAVFITDNSNVALLELHQVYYTPVFIPDGTGWATIDGGLHPDKEGALTIVADKDGKTSLTVRLINNFGEGGQFSYMYGGPKAEHNTNPLTGNSLPRALAKSQMVTFYISKGMGNIKYTIKI